MRDPTLQGEHWIVVYRGVYYCDKQRARLVRRMEQLLSKHNDKD